MKTRLRVPFCAKASTSFHDFPWLFNSSIIDLLQFFGGLWGIHYELVFDILVCSRSNLNSWILFQSLSPSVQSGTAYLRFLCCLPENTNAYVGTCLQRSEVFLKRFLTLSRLNIRLELWDFVVHRPDLQTRLSILNSCWELSIFSICELFILVVLHVVSCKETNNHDTINYNKMTLEFTKTHIN